MTGLEKGGGRKKEREENLVKIYMDGGSAHGHDSTERTARTEKNKRKSWAERHRVLRVI